MYSLKKVFFSLFEEENRYSVIGVVFLYTIIVIVLFYPLLDPNPLFRRYITDDFIHYYFPWVNDLLGSIHLKTLSLNHWNYYASSGSPNIIEGTQYYIPTLALVFFYRLAGNFASVTLIQNFVIAHIILAGLGFYLLLRSKQINIWLAFFGGLIFMISGFMTTVIWVFPIAISIIPWIVISIEKYFREKRIFWLVVSSFLSFQLLAASQQIFIYSLLFLVFYFWVFGQLAQNIKRFIYYVGLTLLFSAIIILPLLELSPHLSRQNYFTPDYLTSASNQLSNLFDLIVYYNYLGYKYLYIGCVSVILIIGHLSDREIRYFRMLLAVLVLFIYGLGSTFIQSITHLLPLISSLRWPSRINQFVVIFLIFMLIQAIQSYQPNFKRELKVSLILTVVLVAGFFIIQIPAESLLLSFLFLFSFVLAVYCHQRELISRKSLFAIIIMLIFLDLSHSFLRVRDHQLGKYQVDISRKLDRSEWFNRQNINPVIPSNFRISEIDFLELDYNKFLLNKEYSAGSYSAAGGDYTPAILKDYDVYLKMAGKNPNLYKAANIKTSDSDTSFYPRAYLVDCYQLAGDNQTSIKIMADSRFSADDRVVLQQKPSFDDIKQVDIDERCQTKYTPTEYTNIDDQIFFSPISVDKPTILFISDNYYPGWEAEVNGQPTEILKANYTFKAVVLAAGENKVVMKFKPKTVWWGAWIFKMTVIFSLIAIIYDIKRKKGKRKNGKKLKS